MQHLGCVCMYVHACEWHAQRSLNHLPFPALVLTDAQGLMNHSVCRRSNNEIALILYQWRETRSTTCVEFILNVVIDERSKVVHAGNKNQHSSSRLIFIIWIAMSLCWYYAVVWICTVSDKNSCTLVATWHFWRPNKCWNSPMVK